MGTNKYSKKTEDPGTHVPLRFYVKWGLIIVGLVAAAYGIAYLVVTQT